MHIVITLDPRKVWGSDGPRSGAPRVQWDGRAITTAGDFVFVEDLITAARVLQAAIREAERVAGEAGEDGADLVAPVVLDPIHVAELDARTGRRS